MVEAALDLAESSGCLQADAERVETDGRDRAQLAVDALQRLLTAMTRRHGVHLATFRLASAICRRWIEWPASNTSDVRVEAIACSKRSRSLASERVVLLVCGLKLEGVFSQLLVHLEPTSFSRVVGVLLALVGEASMSHLLEVLRGAWCNCCQAWMIPGFIRPGQSQTARALDRRIQHPIWSEFRDDRVRQHMIRHMLTRAAAAAGDPFLCESLPSMRIHERHDGCLRVFETSYSAAAAATTTAAAVIRAANTSDEIQLQPAAERGAPLPISHAVRCNGERHGVLTTESALPEADLAELDAQSLCLLRAVICPGAAKLSLLSPASSVLSTVSRALTWRCASTESALAVAISTMAHSEGAGRLLEGSAALISKSGLLSRLLQGLIAWRKELADASTASHDRFCSARQAAFAALEQLTADEQVVAVSNAFSHVHPGAVSFKLCAHVEHCALLWLPSDMPFTKQCTALLNRFVHNSHADSVFMTGVVRLFLLSPVGLCHRLVSEAASNRGQANELGMILRALWPLPALCYGEKKASYLVLAMRCFLSDASPEQSLAGRQNVLQFIGGCVNAADACVDSGELVVYGLLPLLHAGVPRSSTSLALGAMCMVYSAFIPVGRCEGDISGTALALQGAWVMGAAPAPVLISLCELLDALCPSRWETNELGDELLLLLHRLMHTVICWLENGNRFAPSLHQHLVLFLGSTAWRTQVLLHPLQCALRRPQAAQNLESIPSPLQQQLQRCSDVKSSSAVELYNALDALLSLAVVGAASACQEGTRALRDALAGDDARSSNTDQDVIRIAVLLLAEHLPTLPETSYACVVQAFICSLIQSNVLSYGALVTYLPLELRSQLSERKRFHRADDPLVTPPVHPAHARDRAADNAQVKDAEHGGTLDTRHSGRWMAHPSALEAEMTCADRVGTERDRFYPRVHARAIRLAACMRDAVAFLGLAPGLIMLVMSSCAVFLAELSSHPLAGSDRTRVSRCYAQAQ